MFLRNVVQQQLKYPCDFSLQLVLHFTPVMHSTMTAMIAEMSEVISIDLPRDCIQLALQALQHLMPIPLVYPLSIDAIVSHWSAAASQTHHERCPLLYTQEEVACYTQEVSR